MVRWEPGAEDRLLGAAMELFDERGYEQATVAEIAARAGVTERTFFRYFADKREVLFRGGHLLGELIVEAATAAPESADPLGAAIAAVRAAGAALEQRGDFARRRAALIEANPELLERELAKLAGYRAALEQALRERGAGAEQAGLAATLAMTVFRLAFERWTADPGGPPLDRRIEETLGELADLTSSSRATFISQ